MFEVWVLVDEQGKPVLDYNGNLEKVSAEDFAGQLAEDSTFCGGYVKLSTSSGETWCRPKRFVLSELKFMDWY